MIQPEDFDFTPPVDLKETLQSRFPLSTGPILHHPIPSFLHGSQLPRVPNYLIFPSEVAATKYRISPATSSTSVDTHSHTGLHPTFHGQPY